MNIIKRLTALTTLTVFFGILAPTTIAFAKTSSTNDSHAVKSQNPELKTAVGFSQNDPSLQPDSNSITRIFGNSLLQLGDSGPSVAEIQDTLRLLGYYGGEVNGVFGELTADAVKHFQSNQHIAENGLVGPNTKTALYTVYSSSDEASAYKARAAEMKQEEKAAAEKKAKAEAKAKAKAKAEAKEKARKAAEAAAIADREKEQAARKPVKHVKVTKVTKATHKAAKKAPAPQRQAGSSITVTATSYALGGISATGINFSDNPNAKVIAVDPGVIPLGSRVKVPGYGIYTAGDTGGNIKGKRIDIHLPTRQQALQFGRRTMTIQILH
ncbi:3D domain-containing protein [Sporolactobacillus sp. THM19-2]|uniref:3D domain-containing protein n=1 Tax=Sporolactobacillus sp. THM19-2 TaxID=2511171 RepID=UPI001020D54B|nr:3D domain-containing protein [Sporolactobacillus sp. THM19-2]RYL91515.1 peptidoglycan-binding protein [Sporolactobacillus sp. THM19-2]